MSLDGDDHDLIRAIGDRVAEAISDVAESIRGLPFSGGAARGVAALVRHEKTPTGAPMRPAFCDRWTVTTEWRDTSEGVAFRRRHTRIATSINAAIAAEETHNATRVVELAADGFTEWRILYAVAMAEDQE